MSSHHSNGVFNSGFNQIYSIEFFLWPPLQITKPLPQPLHPPLVMSFKEKNSPQTL